MKRTVLAVVTVALALAGAGSSGAGAASPFTPCSGGYNPDGTKGSFYSNIRAKRVSCSVARSVTKAWVVKEARSDGANPTARISVKGYSCKGSVKRMDPRDAEGGLEVFCAQGRKGVRFYGHP